jgi:hypothetical protein
MKERCKKLILKLPLMLGLIALACVSVTTAFAQVAARSKAASNGGSTTVRVAGQQVAIDRATGKLRQPTPAEARALAAGMSKFLNRSTTGLTAVQHPNGAVSMDLHGRFMSVEVAKVNSDGTISEKCVTNMQAAKRFVRDDVDKSALAHVAKAGTSHSTTKPAEKE